MPRWTGCRRLGPGVLFLLCPGRADAFDGRYFGISRRAEIIGTATLLWRA
jgi:type IV secretory pathway protease TraF